MNPETQQRGHVGLEPGVQQLGPVFRIGGRSAVAPRQNLGVRLRPCNDPVFVIALEPALSLRRSRTKRDVEMDALEGPEGTRVLSLRAVDGTGGAGRADRRPWVRLPAVDTPALPKPANLTTGA